MTVSVQKDPHGPDWPLGVIAVPTPGTPVSIMSLVDGTNVNDPTTATPPATGSTSSDEYTRVAQQIIFQAYKAGAAPPRMGANTGNIYIVRKSVGAGGVNDVGSVVVTLQPGQTFILGSSAMVRNAFSLYRYFIDADTALDACSVTAIIQ